MDVIAPKTTADDEAGPVLLYDGDCGLCQRSVQFVLRHDLKGAIRYAPLSSDFARSQLAQAIDEETVVLVDRGEVLVRSQAVLAVLTTLGPPWSYLTVIGFVPRVIRDLAYRLVARVRHEIFPPNDTCLVPNLEQRGRFIE